MASILDTFTIQVYNTMNESNEISRLVAKLRYEMPTTYAYPPAV
jgi:hypothetical protein